MDNPNPIVHANSHFDDEEGDEDDRIRLLTDEADPFTPIEIYKMLRSINDPEHPLTLEQLNVVSPSLVTVTEPVASSRPGSLMVHFTPTIPHCSMATLIGLCIRVQLERCLPIRRFLVRVLVTPGTHQAEQDINKQLADKERVAAALENEQLLAVVNQCLSGPPRVGIAL